MKIKNGFVIRKVGGERVVVPVGEMSKTFHGMVRLNETGAFLWKKLSEADITLDELVDAMLKEYEVDRETAAQDAARLVEQFSENGILE